jgi:hypothetical protein
MSPIRQKRWFTITASIVMSVAASEKKQDHGDLIPSILELDGLSKEK